MPVKLIDKSGYLPLAANEFPPFGKRCLIVTSGSAAKKSGALDDAIKALDKAAIEYKIFSGISQNPLTDECKNAGDDAHDFGADFIIGIGGGSPLDASKAAAVFASNPQMKSNDIYTRDGCNKPIPVILIGTTAGTGSEVTGVSVLTNSQTGRKKSISGPDCYAKTVFCDSKYTESMPYSVTVSSALDAFSHCVESYFAKNSTPDSEYCALKGAGMIFGHLKDFAANGKLPDSEGRKELYEASILGGLAINITGTCFPHTVGYVLTEEYSIPHGRACTAFMREYLDIAMANCPGKADVFFKKLKTDIDGLCSIVDSLTDVNIKMTKEQIDDFASRWKSGVKNFERTPGSFTWENARDILSKYL